MKKLIKIFLFIFLITINFESTFAQEELKVEKLEKKEELKIPKLEKKDLDFIIKDLKDKQSKLKMSSKGQAQSLTYLEVYAVYSDEYGGFEMISQDQKETIGDHGNGMYIITAEIGHSLPSLQYAKLYSNRLSMAKEQPLYFNNDNEVDGWLRWWDAEYSDGGRFTYKATSVNWPVTTMSDTLYIK